MGAPVLTRRFVLAGALAATVAPAEAQRPANTPESWYDYVARTGDRAGPRAMLNHASAIAALETVDRRVNHEIDRRVAAATFIDLGTFREDGNDCTAGALLKRHALVELGFARGALPFAIGLDPRGAWHCVTLALTTRGAYALDTQMPRNRGLRVAADLLRNGPWYAEPEDGWRWRHRLAEADLPRP